MATDDRNFDLNFDFLEECFLEEVKNEREDKFLLPAAPTRKRRFEEVSADDVEKLLKDAENKNTKKKTDCDIRLLRKFISESFPEHEKTELYAIDDDILCDILCKFFTAAKKTDRSEYEPSTIRGI